MGLSASEALLPSMVRVGTVSVILGGEATDSMGGSDVSWQAGTLVLKVLATPMSVANCSLHHWLSTLCGLY